MKPIEPGCWVMIQRCKRTEFVGKKAKVIQEAKDGMKGPTGSEVRFHGRKERAWFISCEGIPVFTWQGLEVDCKGVSVAWESSLLRIDGGEDLETVEERERERERVDLRTTPSRTMF